MRLTVCTKAREELGNRRELFSHKIACFYKKCVGLKKIRLYLRPRTKKTYIYEKSYFYDCACNYL